MWWRGVCCAYHPSAALEQSHCRPPELARTACLQCARAQLPGQRRQRGRWQRAAAVGGALERSQLGKLQG